MIERIDNNHAVKHCFYIIKYLHQHDITKASKLAEELNVSTKQIIRYVRTLREAGVYIDSKSGKNGGYFLKDDKCPLCNKKW